MSRYGEKVCGGALIIKKHPTAPSTFRLLEFGVKSSSAVRLGESDEFVSVLIEQEFDPLPKQRCTVAEPRVRIGAHPHTCMYSGMKSK